MNNRSHSKAAQRKVPRQRRSELRVRMILDTAQQILEDEGYEKLNTNYLAKKSQIPVGSVYQYFPNKESIVARLLEERRLQRNDLLKEAFMRLKSSTIEDLVEELIRTLITHQREFPRSELIFNEKKYGLNLSGLERELDADFIRMLELFLIVNKISLNVSNLRLSLILLVSSIKSASLELLAGDQYVDVEELIVELKNMTIKYLR